MPKHNPGLLVPMEKDKHMDERPTLFLNGQAAMMLDPEILVGERGRYTFDIEKIEDRKEKHDDGGFCISSRWRILKIDGKKIKKTNTIEESMEEAMKETSGKDSSHGK